MAFERLLPYRRNIRPVTADSFPRYVERELDRIATSISELVQAVKDLDARLTATEP